MMTASASSWGPCSVIWDIRRWSRNRVRQVWRCCVAAPISRSFLTDLVLRGALDGIMLATEAREMIPGLKIILMSGHSNRIASDEGVLGEDTILLAKPFRRAELARTLQHVLNQDVTS